MSLTLVFTGFSNRDRSKVKYDRMESSIKFEFSSQRSTSIEEYNLHELFDVGCRECKTFHDRSKSFMEDVRGNVGLGADLRRRRQNYGHIMC
jgi:hypothetical protein